jgi:cyclase
MTVGGGVRSIDDVRDLLRAGADKVAINTSAVKRPELIAEVARRFGSQCMVLSIEAKQQAPGKWEVYTDCGRERSGVDAIDWAKRGVELGAGEILVTSIDREGTRKGFDVDLVKRISEVASVPVIASGGMGEPAHLVEVVRRGRADAVAIADMLHYGRTSIDRVRADALAAGLKLRTVQ